MASNRILKTHCIQISKSTLEILLYQVQIKVRKLVKVLAFVNTGTVNSSYLNSTYDWSLLFPMKGGKLLD